MCDVMWIFGIIDTSFFLAIGYMQVVAYRSASILLLIINAVIKPCLIVHSEEWRGYSRTSVFDFYHGRVNHWIYFVDPITDIRTQTVQSC